MSLTGFYFENLRHQNKHFAVILSMAMKEPVMTFHHSVHTGFHIGMALNADVLIRVMIMTSEVNRNVINCTVSWENVFLLWYLIPPSVRNRWLRCMCSWGLNHYYLNVK